MLLQKIYKNLFFLGVFFIPFNSFNWERNYAFMGELRFEAAAYFFLVSFVFLFLNGKISIPFFSKGFTILLCFVLCCFMSGMVNLYYLLSLHFKNTVGIHRFIRQFISLIILSILFLILFWNVFKSMAIKDILIVVRKIFLYSLLFAGFVSVFEVIICIFGFWNLEKYIHIFDYFPFLEIQLSYNGRISSISYEVPAFAMYLATISGWMFSYILTAKGIKRYLPSVLLIVLMILSGSRTGFMVILIQLAIFIWYLYKNDRIRPIHLKFLKYISFLILILVLFNSKNMYKIIEEKIDDYDFVGNLKQNISNQSRFGTQYATLLVFRDHPIFGVGYAQLPFYSNEYYPYWAKVNNFEYKMYFVNQNNDKFPPSYNMFLRLAAETGIVGLFLFLLMIYYVIALSIKFVLNSEDEVKIISLVVLITFVGLSMNWLQTDTLKLFGFWLCFALLMRIQYHKKMMHKNE
jgi:O-antigen ligase